MSTKRVLFTIALAIATITGVKAEGSGLQIGAKMNIYSRWNGMVGIGPYVRYDIASTFRVESALLILTKRGSSIDWSNELQMPFRLSSALELYPLVGVSLNDPSKFGVALGLGGGASWNLNDRVLLTGGVKWNLQSQQLLRNPLIFSVGAGFKM